MAKNFGEDNFVRTGTRPSDHKNKSVLLDLIRRQEPDLFAFALIFITILRVHLSRQGLYSLLLYFCTHYSIVTNNFSQSSWSEWRKTYRIISFKSL